MSNIEMEIIRNENQINIIVELASVIWHEHYDEFLPDGQVDYMLKRFQSKEAIDDQIKNDIVYKIVYFNGDIAGYYAIKKDSKKIFISKVYVLSSFRRKGISKAIMDDIIKQSKVFSTLYLTVNKYNTGSIKAYESLGFKIIDEIKNDIGNGYYMDDYIMEKAL